MKMVKPEKPQNRKSEIGPVLKSADWPLSTRPGFLVRRLHQIHISLFMEACVEFRITPLQYSVLSILAASSPTDQTKLAAAVALDRTTTTGIVKRLNARGLTRRMTSKKDRRAQLCSLTAAGKALLVRMESSARKAHEDTLTPLSCHERTTLLRLLAHVVSAHADHAQQSAATFLGKL
jgi:MarR family transcriptional regulator, lower aerobic nicotinate degradation pathway regulator